ncbi:heme-binding protein 1-like [Uloborus diversus]|nr:heme-binding protein 1-like [Uloborus diversus]
MLKVAALVIFASVVVSGCRYKDSECADYVVVEQHADYEIRSYPALTWVMTSEESRVPRIAKFKTFRRLFNYISGENDQGIKINMTVPVRMRSTKTDGKTTLEMSFLLPSVVSSSPPVPNDKSLTVSAEDPTLYAVR